MPNLTEALTTESKKSAVVDDCVALIDAEVADKGGLTGLAIKAGYGTVKGIKPGFVRQVVSDLLPEFAHALEAEERREALRAWLTEQDIEYGPLPEEAMEQVRREWLGDVDPAG